jgi:hypothetical protein
LVRRREVDANAAGHEITVQPINIVNNQKDPTAGDTITGKDER